ncbi:ENR1 protein, partial [Chloroceryle aenea]|nr:ENR1 protein [Chloroceryle aenea]
KLRDLQLPRLGQNLFLDLMQCLVTASNVSGCWACGGAMMTEEWPWKDEGLRVKQLLGWNHTEIATREHRPDGWILSSEVRGPMCLKREG